MAVTTAGIGILNWHTIKLENADGKKLDLATGYLTLTLRIFMQTTQSPNVFPSLVLYGTAYL